jgi:hypothetical protein
MTRLSEQIFEHIKHQPEGALFGPKAFLHLGSRAAVDQALSRLAKRGKLWRAARGRYVRPIKSRFGLRAPATESVVGSVSHQDKVIPSGASAANALGLTQQVPIREVYLTAGPSRKLRLGSQLVEVRRAPEWQRFLPEERAGDVVRALAWLGPERLGAAVPALKSKLSSAERRKLLAITSDLPSWLAPAVSRLAAR